MTLHSITERLHSLADVRFRFEPIQHEYFLGERKLTPFSTWIKDFISPFDEAKIAPGYAAKNGLTVPQVLALWEQNRWVGTMLHKAIELFYQGHPFGSAGNESPHDEVAARFAKFLALYDKRLFDLVPIGLELQLWSELLGICGTLDLVAYHRGTKKVFVLDYKTNSSFSTNAGRNYRKMLGPFHDLWENKETQYSLQISFYRVLLEQAGIPTAGGALIHLPPGDAPATIYQATDYCSRILNILY